MKVDPVLFGIPCFHISFISKYNIRTEKYTNHVRESERESESEVAQSCLTLCDPMDYSLPGSSVYGILQGKNTGVGCHLLLQGIFLTQGSNLGLQNCRQTL